MLISQKTLTYVVRIYFINVWMLYAMRDKKKHVNKYRTMMASGTIVRLALCNINQYTHIDSAFPFIICVYYNP